MINRVDVDRKSLVYKSEVSGPPHAEVHTVTALGSRVIFIHSRRLLILVSVNGQALGMGTGPSKAKAKQAAAIDALKHYPAQILA